MQLKTRKTQLALLFCFIADGLFLDQLSKIWLDQTLKEPKILLENIFSLRIEHNTGIAFSVSLPYHVLLILNFLFFGGIVFFMLKTLDLKRFQSIFVIGLLTAGALGNLIDRIRLGYVIDFISIASYPVFNIADMFITIAVFLLLLFYDKIERQI